MDAILLIFAIQLAILIAFLALSLDFSKLNNRLSLRKTCQFVITTCARSLSFCFKGYLSNDEILPESILETRPEDEKDRPNDSRVILLENKQNLTQMENEEENNVKEIDIEVLAADIDMKSNELFSSDVGITKFFSRAFCWIFSIRVTLFSGKKNYSVVAKTLSSSSPKISAIKAAKKRSFNYFQCSAKTEMTSFSSSQNRSEFYSLRYKNDLVSPKTALLFRKKIIKLNFIILKKKKTRPLSVIYEIPEEGYWRLKVVDWYIWFQLSFCCFFDFWHVRYVCFGSKMSSNKDVFEVNILNLKAVWIFSLANHSHLWKLKFKMSKKLINF